jgi:uncharacterized membrane protein YbhN (UPF0104 family)
MQVPFNSTVRHTPSGTVQGSVPRRRKLIVALQALLVTAMVVFVVIEFRSSWSELRGRLEDIRMVNVAGATALLATYYCVFVLGWMAILRAFGMRLGYRGALGAEMVSMLAKYIPGGVWTPAARVVACRRMGLPGGPVLASIGYEAGLSAIAGVAVFAVALPFAPHVGLPVPLWVMLAFAAVLLVLLQPRVFGPIADRLLVPLGDEPAPRLPVAKAASILVFYVGTWLIGGAALAQMARAFGGDVPVTAVPYLGGASAIGAIAAVLVIFAPSGLGVREGAMYALLLAYVDPATALVTVALNRVLLTLVEAGLLGGVLVLRRLERVTAGSGAPPAGTDPS